MKYLSLFLAGGTGTVCRYLLSLWMTERTDPHFPWGTLTVNSAGCLVIGTLLGSGILDRFQWADLKIFIVTGFLGGFTTFSAFSAETLMMFEARRPFAAVTYVVLSVIGGIAACTLGFWVARVAAK